MRPAGPRSRLLVMACLLLAAACTPPPTAEGDGDSGLVDVTGRLNEINGELEGLEPDARRERLIQMAAEEGGSFNAYGSTNLDDVFPMIDEFESLTGLEVNYYRASSADVLQRVLQEADAGFPGTDVVLTNGPELQVIDGEGLLAPLDSPVTDRVPEEGVFDNWVWFYLNTFAASWNTDSVSTGPTSWEDVLSIEDGLALEVGDFDWFATLVKSYFVERNGMTEKEAIDLFRQAARNASLVNGHSLMLELLAAGEYDYAASTYLHGVLQHKKEGAPVEWEGGPEPIIVRPNGIAIHRYAVHPASALLFLEFMMTEAQQLLLDIDRQPATEGVEGGGIPSGVDTIVVDLDALLEEREKWEGLWAEIIEGSGGEVVED
ncbi:MAG: ABC transporter substrate-binding protein [Actinomycetota bacterium]